jgi:hypothetical protein
MIVDGPRRKAPNAGQDLVGVFVQTKGFGAALWASIRAQGDAMTATPEDRCDKDFGSFKS